MQIPTTDHRNILRNAKTRIQDCFHRSNRERVVICKNPIWYRRSPQQEAHSLRSHSFAIDIDSGSSDD